MAKIKLCLLSISLGMFITAMILGITGNMYNLNDVEKVIARNYCNFYNFDLAPKEWHQISGEIYGEYTKQYEFTKNNWYVNCIKRNITKTVRYDGSRIMLPIE